MRVSGLPFVIIYGIGQDMVEIIRILHGAQHWPVY
jgi:plasmid stabilization system protein ParE